MRAVHVLFASALLACGTDPDAPRPSPPREPVLDPTFAGGRMFTWGGTHDEDESGVAVVRQSEGSLVVAAHSSRTDFVDVVRLTHGGVVDPTFGTDRAGPARGHAIIPGIPSNASVSLAAAPDGRLFVMGFTTVLENPDTDGARRRTRNAIVARLDADGALDATWGSNGLVTVPTIGSASDPSRLAVQSDAKLLVLTGDGNASRVTRLASNGSVDASFGTEGVATIPGLYADGAMAVDAADGIVIGGIGGGTLATGARILRLRSDGSVDASFANAGSADLPFPHLTVRALAIDGVGRVIAGGARSAGTGGGGFVARVASDGALDSSFNAGISAFVAKPVSAVEADAAGRIVVWSTGQLTRLDENGAVDATFGGTGTIVNPSPMTTYAGLVEPDGGVVNVGSIDRRVAITRRNADGAVDATFGSGGIAITSLPLETDDLALAFSSMADGKTVLRVASDTGESRLLALTTDGKLDATFGTDGVVSVPSGIAAVDDRGRALAIQRVEGGVVVQRYDRNGAVDPTFGPKTPGAIGPLLGGAPEDVRMAVHPDGRIVVAGTRGTQILLVRTDEVGARDVSFGTNGSVAISLPIANATIPNIRLGRVTSLDDGGVIVAAVIDFKSAVIHVGADGGAVVRATPQGSPAIFGGANHIAFGNAATTHPHVALRQPNGGVVVLTTFDGGYDGYVIERFDAAGTLDASFGAGGAILNVETGPSSGYLDGGGPDLAIDATGRLYVATVAPDLADGGRDHPAVFRYTSDGNRDESWGPRGRRLFPNGGGDAAARCIRILADGSFLIGGRIADNRLSLPDARSDAFVAKILP